MDERIHIRQVYLLCWLKAFFLYFSLSSSLGFCWVQRCCAFSFYSAVEKYKIRAYSTYNLNLCTFIWLLWLTKFVFVFFFFPLNSRKNSIRWYCVSRMRDSSRESALWYKQTTKRHRKRKRAMERRRKRETRENRFIYVSTCFDRACWGRNACSTIHNYPFVYTCSITLYYGFDHFYI